MNETAELLKSIIKGIQEKKGHRIVTIDLSKTEGAIAKYFVICEGNSPTQVEAITDSVSDMAHEEQGEKPTKVIGLEQCHWVAMDYGDVIVHIFVPEMREFYNLENLWQDAPMQEIIDE